MRRAALFNIRYAKRASDLKVAFEIKSSPGLSST